MSSAVVRFLLLTPCLECTKIVRYLCISLWRSVLEWQSFKTEEGIYHLVLISIHLDSRE
jgi:hypothetical protein